GRVPGTPEWPDHNLATAQAFADVVVRLTLELEVHARQREGAEALPGTPPEPQPQPRSRPLAAVLPRQLPGDTRADCEVVIADRIDPGGNPLLVENLGVERDETGSNIPFDRAPARLGLVFRRREQQRKIEQARARSLRSLDAL